MTGIKLIFAASLLASYTAYSQIDSISSQTTDTTSRISATTRPPEKVNGKSDQVYKLKPAVDIPIMAVGTGWSLYAFTKIYKKTPLTEAQVLALKKEDVNAFDRGNIYPYSKSIDKQSYIPFYASIPLPLLVFALDKKMRKDYFKLVYLYYEAFAITGLCGTAATYFVDRYRPYEYTAETPISKDTTSWGLNSFYSGHSQVVAVSTFFCAKVYDDYHPGSRMKWVFYGIAAGATGLVSYQRLVSGEHFLSDIMVGAAMGTLSGILVPQFHKHPLFKNKNVSMMPYINNNKYGLSFSYTPH